MYCILKAWLYFELEILWDIMEKNEMKWVNYV